MYHRHVPLLFLLLSCTAVLTACQRDAAPVSPQEQQRLAGERAFEVCSYCHTARPGGAHKTGPNLFAVYGRRAASAPGYRYSTALQQADLVWNEETLDAYLRHPSVRVPGTRMVNATVDPSRRAQVIAYLKSLSPPAAVP